MGPPTRPPGTPVLMQARWRHGLRHCGGDADELRGGYAHSVVTDFKSMSSRCSHRVGEKHGAEGSREEEGGGDSDPAQWSAPARGPTWSWRDLRELWLRDLLACGDLGPCFLGTLPHRRPAWRPICRDTAEGPRWRHFSLRTAVKGRPFRVAQTRGTAVWGLLFRSAQVHARAVGDMDTRRPT